MGFTYYCLDIWSYNPFQLHHLETANPTTLQSGHCIIVVVTMIVGIAVLFFSCNVASELKRVVP